MSSSKKGKRRPRIDPEAEDSNCADCLLWCGRHFNRETLDPRFRVTVGLTKLTFVQYVFQLITSCIILGYCCYYLT